MKIINYRAPDPDRRLRQKRRKWAKDRLHDHRSCITKIVYDTETEADDKAAELNDREDNWYPRAAYKCWYCPGWHVGRTYPVDPHHRAPSLHDIEELLRFYAFNEREMGCIRLENRGHMNQRQRAIRDRYRAVLKRRAREAA